MESRANSAYGPWPLVCLSCAAERRAIFDFYGEKGLKEGVKTATGGQRASPLTSARLSLQWSQPPPTHHSLSVCGRCCCAAETKPYTFASSPSALFDSVFGTLSPFSALFSYNTSDALAATPAAAKPATQEIKLYLSLEEVYRGCTKKVKVARKRLTTASSPSTAASFTVDERLLAVTVLPGYPASTRITFPNEGDQHPTAQPALYGDIAFVVTDRPHPLYRRVGADLLHTHRLPLREALCGSVVELRLLDDRLLSVALSDVCRPGARKVVKGEGMPKVGKGGDSAGKGDLLIEYEVEFPDQLTLGQKDGIRQLLG